MHTPDKEHSDRHSDDQRYLAQNKSARNLNTVVKGEVSRFASSNLGYFSLRDLTPQRIRFETSQSTNVDNFAPQLISQMQDLLLSNNQEVITVNLFFFFLGLLNLQKWKGDKIK